MLPLISAYAVLQEMSSIDNVMKSKLNNYNIAKGSLVQIQRKKM
jgi:V-type H+-transporting ATPase subunit C